jgi:hypothetical protein
MSSGPTTSTDTGQHTPTRGREREAQQPVTQQERSAAQRFRTTMAAVWSEPSSYWRNVTLPFPISGDQQ